MRFSPVLVTRRCSVVFGGSIILVKVRFVVHLRVEPRRLGSTSMHGPADPMQVQFMTGCVDIVALLQRRSYLAAVWYSVLDLAKRDYVPCHHLLLSACSSRTLPFERRSLRTTTPGRRSGRLR